MSADPNAKVAIPSTPPYDPRFPNTNQTRNCWQNFVDFHRCKNRYGEEYQPCKYFEFAYHHLCPNEWHQKWTEEVEAGTFRGKLE